MSYGGAPASTTQSESGSNTPISSDHMTYIGGSDNRYPHPDDDVELVHEDPVQVKKELRNAQNAV
jgi:hypothetical protein